MEANPPGQKYPRRWDVGQHEQKSLLMFSKGTSVQRSPFFSEIWGKIDVLMLLVALLLCSNYSAVLKRQIWLVAALRPGRSRLSRQQIFSFPPFLLPFRPASQGINVSSDICPTPPMKRERWFYSRERKKEESSLTSVKNYVGKGDGDGVDLKDFVNE